MDEQGRGEVGLRERDIHVADSGDVFEYYVPPEGDSRKSIISKEGTLPIPTPLGSESELNSCGHLKVLSLAARA